MTLSDEAVQEFKDIYKKEYGSEISDTEARAAGENLIGLMELLIKQSEVEERRKTRLTEEPEGFHLPTGEYYNCIVCHRDIEGKTSWWDIYGPKCLDCQKNLKAKVLPPEYCNNHKLWLAMWQLKSYFDLHSSTVRKMQREGELVGIDLKTESGVTYFTIFPVEANRKSLVNLKKKKEVSQNL